MFSRTWNGASKDSKRRVLIYKEKFLYSSKSNWSLSMFLRKLLPIKLFQVQPFLLFNFYYSILLTTSTMHLVYSNLHVHFPKRILTRYK